MGVFFLIEANRPCGSSYRLGFGCHVHPWASTVAAVLRLL
jgi:hypothetical protein